MALSIEASRGLLLITKKRVIPSEAKSKHYPELKLSTLGIEAGNFVRRALCTPVYTHQELSSVYRGTVSRPA